MSMIRIKYKCVCMQDPGSFEVRERRETEDICGYVQYVVTPALHVDHRTRNPVCQSEKCEYIKIPAPQGKRIGQA